MNKSKIKGVLTLILGVIFFQAGPLSAFDCCDPCRGPLKECSVRIGIRGGVSPTYYTDKSENLLIGDTGVNGVLGTSSVPDFSDQFDLPWVIGGHIGYTLSDHIEVFLDGQYTHGDGDTYIFAADPFEVTQVFTDFESWSLYAGARYYFCGWDMCGQCLSLFIGGKLGFRQYDAVDFTEDLVGPVNISFDSRDYYKSHTVPSIGAQIGLEWFFSSCLSANIMAEFIYSGQLRSEFQSTNGGVGVQTVSVGDTGPLFSIPITVGINFSM